MGERGKERDKREETESKSYRERQRRNTERWEGAEVADSYSLEEQGTLTAITPGLLVLAFLLRSLSNIDSWNPIGPCLVIHPNLGFLPSFEEG